MDNRKTAVYCRLASVCNDGLIERKELALLDYAKRNGYAPCVCYRDNGYSGVQLDRPGLQNLLSDIRSGGIGRVIVADIVRLSRSFIHTNELLRMFADHDVEFISVNDGFSSSEYAEHLLFADGLAELIKAERCIRQGS